MLVNFQLSLPLVSCYYLGQLFSHSCYLFTPKLEHIVNQIVKSKHNLTEWIYRLVSCTSQSKLKKTFLLLVDKSVCMILGGL